MDAPARYMLDTNMVSFIMRGSHLHLIQRLRSKPMQDLCISAITEAELRFGLARRPDARGLKETIDALLLRLQTLPWDSQIAHPYANLRAQLESRGTPLAHLDTLIAAHALALGHVLVTNDQAFRRVPGLQVEDWTQA
jgi:tRNA(fMet)-specific endonuclease VapC